MSSRTLGIVGAFWGLAGIFLLLGSAIYRLGSRAVEAPFGEFDWLHWTTLVAIVLFMAYAEGYRGFQTKFSPRVAARAHYLINNPKLLHLALAPLFCMGYFHATRRRQIASIALTLGIIGLVLLVRLAPTPWREIIDAGVVVGLGWGVISLAVFAVQGLFNDDFPYSPEVPEEAQTQAVPQEGTKA